MSQWSNYPITDEYKKQVHKDAAIKRFDELFDLMKTTTSMNDWHKYSYEQRQIEWYLKSEHEYDVLGFERIVL